MLLNILICDDDIMIVNKITSLLNHYFSQHSMEYLIFSSVDSGEIYESDQVFDIAYIDIEMPGINGLKLSQKLKQNNPDILIMIITAFESYLDDAMEIHVYRYLS